MSGCTTENNRFSKENCRYYYLKHILVPYIIQEDQVQHHLVSVLFQESISLTPWMLDFFFKDISASGILSIARFPVMVIFSSQLMKEEGETFVIHFTRFYSMR